MRISDWSSDVCSSDLRGGAVYMLGRNGGLMNDRRGHTAAAHLFHRFPDFAPKRLLELGCGIGASPVPLAGYFPGPEAHGIDVGAAELRYAHACPAHLGAAVHLRLGDAIVAPCHEESFGLVFYWGTNHAQTPGPI